VAVGEVDAFKVRIKNQVEKIDGYVGLQVIGPCCAGAGTEDKRLSCQLQMNVELVEEFGWQTRKLEDLSKSSGGRPESSKTFSLV
jgi:hypothetical protein